MSSPKQGIEVEGYPTIYKKNDVINADVNYGNMLVVVLLGYALYLSFVEIECILQRAVK